MPLQEMNLKKKYLQLDKQLYLEKNKKLIDGNKRTAYLSTLLFLRKNHYKLNLTPDIGEALIIQVTVAEDTEEEMLIIADFLKEQAVFEKQFSFLK